MTYTLSYSGCDDKDKTWREKIIEAYSDASELVNHEDITEDLDFNSAAALQFLGPSGLNKDQQAQIQNVITNLATVKEGASWFTPNWIRVSLVNQFHQFQIAELTPWHRYDVMTR